MTLLLFRTAQKKEIVRAYRKLAAIWHPDQYNGDDKKRAEKMFIDIAAAKEVLTDPGNIRSCYCLFITFCQGRCGRETAK